MPIALIYNAVTSSQSDYRGILASILAVDFSIHITYTVKNSKKGVSAVYKDVQNFDFNFMATSANPFGHRLSPFLLFISN